VHFKWDNKRAQYEVFYTVSDQLGVFCNLVFGLVDMRTYCRQSWLFLTSTAPVYYSGLSDTKYCEMEAECNFSENQCEAGPWEAPPAQNWASGPQQKLNDTFRKDFNPAVIWKASLCATSFEPCLFVGYHGTTSVMGRQSSFYNDIAQNGRAMEKAVLGRLNDVYCRKYWCRSLPTLKDKKEKLMWTNSDNLATAKDSLQWGVSKSSRSVLHCFLKIVTRLTSCFRLKTNPSLTKTAEWFVLKF